MAGISRYGGLGNRRLLLDRCSFRPLHVHGAPWALNSREVIEATHALAVLLEATGEYYYETEEVKRWVLGDGGKSGNCEGCEGNADMGWISDEDPFTEGWVDLDGPPLHEHCDCELEYKTRRYRVYVDDEDEE